MAKVEIDDGMKALAASLFKDKPKSNRNGSLTLMSAMREHLRDDPLALPRIIDTMVRVAQDDKHPQMSTVQRMLLDRLDGPVKQQVQVAWEKATEGITLHLPGKKAQVPTVGEGEGALAIESAPSEEPPPSRIS